MKTNGILMLGCAMLAGGAFAGDVTWPGTAGGDIDVAANWGGALPSSSADMVYFSSVQTGPFTLSGDTTTFYRMQFDAPGTNVFDLGAGKSALVSNRIFFKGGTTVHLKSGTLGCPFGGERIFIGNDMDGNGLLYGGNTLIVDGPSAVFQGSGGDSTGYTSYKFIGLGINNANNTILVKNGGTVQGEMRIGSNQKYSSNNVFRVTGSGSSFVSVGASRRFEIGSVGGWNLAEFLDGGTMTVPGVVTVGGYQQINNDNKLGYWRGPCNMLRLSGAGTTGTVSGNMQVGLGSSSNSVEIMNGATLDLDSRLCVGLLGDSYPSSLASNPCHNVFCVAPGGCVRQVSGSRANSRNIIAGDAEGATGNVVRVCGDYFITDSKKAYSYIGLSGPDSSLEIDGGRMIVTNSGGFFIGRAETAVGSGFSVVDGGFFEHYLTNAYFYLYCGYDAPNCRVNVDNATLRLKSAPGLGVSTSVIYLGYGQTASNSCLACVNGGLLEAGRMIVGLAAQKCSLAVTNASVRLAANLDVGYGNTAPLPTNCVVSIAGTNATIVAQGSLRFWNNSRIEYAFPGDGNIASPAITCSSLDTTSGDGLSIAVRIGKGCCGRNRTVELLRTTSGAITDASFNKLTFDLPEGVRIERQNNAIVAHIAANKGIVMSFK